MIEFLEWAVAVMGYSVAGGASFRAAANRTNRPKEPFTYPGPTFAGLFWPLYFPAVIGNSIIRTGGAASKDEQRRAREIEERQHRIKVAELEAKELSIKERSLNLND